MKRICALLSVVLAAAACGKNSDSSDKQDNSVQTPDPSGSPNPNGNDQPGDGLVASGTLAISGVTHVYAVAPDGNSQVLSPVGADGSFSIGIKKDRPTLLAAVDKSKTGKDMIVGQFGSGSLDSLVLESGKSTSISLGALAISTSLTAEGLPLLKSDKTLDALNSEMGITAETAATIGAADDVMGRFSNPDIDGNGLVDTEEGKNFRLDFHNRFTIQKSDNSNLTMDDLKNTFPPDTAVFKYGGTGIIPEFNLNDMGIAGKPYSWTFSSQATTSPTNCGATVIVGGVIPANTPCSVSGEDTSYLQKLAINVSGTPPHGTYKLSVDSKTFIWAGVKFNDLTAGKGFMAIFVKYNVDSNNKLNSIDFKFKIKNGAGVYILATAQEMSLLMKPQTARLSLKVDGSTGSKGFGVNIPEIPESNVKLSSISADQITGIPASEVTSGIDFDRVKQNPGLSYDDKLGMRFFF